MEKSFTCLLTNNSSYTTASCILPLPSFKNKYHCILSMSSKFWSNFRAWRAEDARIRKSVRAGLKMNSSSERSNAFKVHLPFTVSLSDFVIVLKSERAFALQLLRVALLKSTLCVEVHPTQSGRVITPRYLHPNLSAASGHYRPHPFISHWEMKNLSWTCASVYLRLWWNHKTQVWTILMSLIP